MTRQSTIAVAGSVALLISLAACGSPGESGTMDDAASTKAPAVDTTRLGALYTQIDEAYDSLMTRVHGMSGQLSPEQQGLYRSMEAMHGQASAMHQHMMAGSMMAAGKEMGRGGMMGGGRMMDNQRTGASVAGLREWDEQMRSMHQAMASLYAQDGDPGLGAMHQRMAALYEQALQATPEGEITPPQGREERPIGQDIFAQTCSPCHGAAGRGYPGAFPPLAASEWVIGDAQRPVRIVLFGLHGAVDVAGNTFNGTMPAFGARLSDDEIAAVLTFIRSQWGNDAPAVDVATVASVREEGPVDSSDM